MPTSIPMYRTRQSCQAQPLTRSNILTLFRWEAKAQNTARAVAEQFMERLGNDVEVTDLVLRREEKENGQFVSYEVVMNNRTTGKEARLSVPTDWLVNPPFDMEYPEVDGDDDEDEEEIE